MIIILTFCIKVFYKKVLEIYMILNMFNLLPFSYFYLNAKDEFEEVKFI